jgi:protease IV
MKFFFVLFSGLLTNCISLDLRTSSQRVLKEHVIIKGRSDQKIAVIDLSGAISTQGKSGMFDKQASVVQHVLSSLELAEKDDQVKAVMLRISSPGGASVASEMLYHEIKRFKERSKKKVLAYSLDISASGAYYASIASDYIMAYPNSLVGSIGALYVRPEFKDLTDKIGIKFHVYKSGSNKDMGNPFKSPSENENYINKNITNTLGKSFLSYVVAERKITNKENIKKIASAQIFLAEESQSLGLIDATGSVYEAVEKLEQLASLHRAQIVSYGHYDMPNDNLYNITSQSVVKQNFTTIAEELIKTNGYYYLSPLVVKEFSTFNLGSR